MFQKVEVDKERFEKWCEENNKKKDEKLSMLEFMAVVEKEENSVKAWEMFKKGELTEEAVHFIVRDEIDVNDPKNLSNVSEENLDGFVMVLRGIAMMYETDIDDRIKFLDNLDKLRRMDNEMFKKLYLTLADKMCENASIIYAGMAVVSSTFVNSIEKTKGDFENDL